MDASIGFTSLAFGFVGRSARNIAEAYGDHGVLPIPFCGIYLTPVFLNVRFAPIALLNSKNGLQRFFREKSNQATIADRCVLKRATEVAGEVIASCCGPPARLFDRHAHSPENLSSAIQKEFCNTSRQERSFARSHKSSLG
ncbi:hypothetical protein [Bradyrhizobium sp.]|uniref:hypothetical protein n=1 Tax=Bradyrhizobium sp. TaxID=376 RepID=UPI003BAFDF72